jgi:hypothetical protein
MCLQFRHNLTMIMSTLTSIFFCWALDNLFFFWHTCWLATSRKWTVDRHFFRAFSMLNHSFCVSPVHPEDKLRLFLNSLLLNYVIFTRQAFGLAYCCCSCYKALVYAIACNFIGGRIKLKINNNLQNESAKNPAKPEQILPIWGKTGENLPL